MSKYHELSTTGRDREDWISLLNRLPAGMRDLHYHPDYMRIHEMTYGDRAVLFVHEADGNAVLQPFIMRKIPGDTRCDVTSVYGHGGPLATGEADFSEFQSALAAWFAENGFVSEFCLLSPFHTDMQAGLLAPGLQPEKRKEIVVADLSQDMHVLWANIEERQRKACAVARRKGVIIEYSALGDDDFADFQARYLTAMDRVGASDFWKFPDNYFSNCRDALGTEHVTLLSAVFEGKRIATFFHIHMYDTVYYHFACADPAYRNLNPTSLLLLDSLIWAKSAGFRWFHMGGGRTSGQDSLFTFKYSFCRATLPLYCYTRIVDTMAYDALVAATEAREIAEAGAVQQNDFFPRYRSQTT